jgi:hypothetical protein
LTATVASALATAPALARQSAPKNVTQNGCRPAALRDFCRCVDPPPVERHHVDPSLTRVRRPLPSGVAILAEVRGDIAIAYHLVR